MKDINSCDREKEILRAFADGFVSDEMKKHLRQCVSCQTATAISAGLQQLKSAAIQKANTPNYYGIILQAQWRADERRLKRFTWVYRLGSFTAIILFTGLTAFLLKDYIHSKHAPIDLSSTTFSIIIPAVICLILSEVFLKGNYKTIKGKI